MPNDQDEKATHNAGVWDASDPGHAELVQVRIRMIALENIVLAILSGPTTAFGRRCGKEPPKFTRETAPLRIRSPNMQGMKCSDSLLAQSAARTENANDGRFARLIEDHPRGSNKAKLDRAV